jgi:ABC-type polysaccharide/polyol phosphate export permease
MSTLAQLRSSRELLWNLTLRELRTKYRRSVLGWAWSMLNPLATVAIYSFVFGKLLGAQAERGDPSGLDNFALFLLCGLLPWNFFGLVQNLGMGALIGNAGLVRKVAFPREVLVLAQVGHGMVQFGIEMLLLAVVLLIAGSPILPWLPVTILLMLMLAAFAAGLALALSAIGVYFRDLPYLWAIVLQVWFFATPIVYPPTLLAEQLPTWANRLLSYNPMARYCAAFRRTLYDGTAPGWLSMLALAAMSAAMLMIGWKIFERLSVRFAEEL